MWETYLYFTVTKGQVKNDWSALEGTNVILSIKYDKQHNEHNEYFKRYQHFEHDIFGHKHVLHGWGIRDKRCFSRMPHRAPQCIGDPISVSILEQASIRHVEFGYYPPGFDFLPYREL